MCFSERISLGDEEKLKDSLSNGKYKKQLIKINSTSPALQNEHTSLGYAESSPDCISKNSRRCICKTEIRVMFSQNLDDDVVKQQKRFFNCFRLPIFHHN